MIRNEFVDCTVITIAHRLNSIMNYDKIMVLKDGLMTEYDTPLKLLDNPNSEFYKLVNSKGDEYANMLTNIAR